MAAVHLWNALAGGIVGAILQKLWDLRTITALRKAVLEIKQIDNVRAGQIRTGSIGKQ